MLKANFTQVGDRYEGFVWHMPDNQMADTIVVKTTDKIGLVVAQYKNTSKVYKVLVAKIYTNGDLDKHFSRSLISDFNWVDDGDPEDMADFSEFSIITSLGDFQRYSANVYSLLRGVVTPTMASAAMSQGIDRGNETVLTSTLASEYLKIKSSALIKSLSLDRVVGFKEYIAKNMPRLIRDGY